MSNFTTTDPDFAIGGSRIFVSLVALLSIFVDPYQWRVPWNRAVCPRHSARSSSVQRFDVHRAAKDLRPSRLGDHFGSAGRVFRDRCGVHHRRPAHQSGFRFLLFLQSLRQGFGSIREPVLG